ncbi:MAG: hypothetical protein CNLJKLNK_00261 [Holosporales bacterium]
MLGIAFVAQSGPVFASSIDDELKELWPNDDDTFMKGAAAPVSTPLTRDPFSNNGSLFVKSSQVTQATATGNRDSIDEAYVYAGSTDSYYYNGQYYTGYYNGKYYYGYPYYYGYKPHFTGKHVRNVIKTAAESGTSVATLVAMVQTPESIAAIKQVSSVSNFNHSDRKASTLKNRKLNLAHADGQQIFRELDQIGQVEVKNSSYRLWARPFYQYGKDKSSNPTKSWNAGSLFGLVYKNNQKSFAIGFVTGFDFGKANSNAIDVKATSNGFIYGLQASYGIWNNAAVDFLYLGTTTKIKLKRTDVLGVANASTRKKSDAFDIRLSHYLTKAENKWMFGGIIGHQWTYDKVGAYTETGAGNDCLSVAQVKGRAADVFLGARLIWNGLNKDAGSDAWKWQLRGDYFLHYKYKAKGNNYIAKNIVENQNVTLNYAPRKGWAHQVEALASVQKNAWSFGVSGNLTFAKKYIGAGLQLGAKYRF